MIIANKVWVVVSWYNDDLEIEKIFTNEKAGIEFYKECKRNNHQGKQYYLDAYDALDEWNGIGEYEG